MRFALARSPNALAVGGFALAVVGNPAFAAGFQINESSASGLGNAFAGGAAAAEDASTLWSNAAGISRLGSRQVVGVIHLVTPSKKFHDEGSIAAANQPLGGTGGDAGGVNVVPNLYFSMPINQEWTAGIGLSSPWGLVTEYDGGWIGRFQAMKSSIKTYNVNPAVSWKPAGNFAFGLGFNFQRIEAEFTNQVNYGGALASGAQGLLTAGRINASQFAQIVRDSYGLESAARIEGSDNEIGWNVGLLWDLDANSRIGAQYRSRITYSLRGDATFVNPAAPATVPAALVAAVNGQLSNTSITSDIEMPEVVNLSYFRTIDGKWDVMVDAQWTGWSSIQSLTILRSSGSVLQSTPQNFKDVWKVAFGVNYRYNDQWMWRGGLAWDQSPVEDEYRTPRLPDSDRTWLSAGVQYKMNNALKFDFGGAYILGRDASINVNGHPPSTPTYGLLKGHYEGNAWVLSAQGTWSF